MTKKVMIKPEKVIHYVYAKAVLQFNVSEYELKQFRKSSKNKKATVEDYVKAAMTPDDAIVLGWNIDEVKSEVLEKAQYATRKVY